eukprot:TRINITY_DN20093_c0_g3_i1.p2 TRINITY_DN20093_c0_g3~~TRINITY_DN20093_c0_g3_i1.p2  ORF type:complete len:176 (-),score=22.46 TRINITY_DN20093_c0_g3_i1:1029-1556(-)
MDAARDVSASIGQFLQGGSRSGRLGKLLEVLRCLHHMPGLVPRGRFDESQAGETPDYDDVESWLAHPQRRPGERAVEDANHLAPKDVILPVVEERPCDCFFVVDSCYTPEVAIAFSGQSEASRWNLPLGCRRGDDTTRKLNAKVLEQMQLRTAAALLASIRLAAFIRQRIGRRTY